MSSSITLYDNLIIGVYFVFVLVIGLVFRRLSKNTSDYFRCGGAMPWWITGASVWIASFSAWTFTGAAGKIYETGTMVLLLYYSHLIGFAVVFFFTCKRFRRMRVVTWMEAVRARYGTPTEQFYTWLKVPIILLLSGVSLNTIGVFIVAVFHLPTLHLLGNAVTPMTTVLLTLGIVVTLVSLVGGAWAVLASDFVQMFLIVTITLVLAFLCLHHPKIGGIAGLIHQLPHSTFHWGDLERVWIIIPYALTMMWFSVSTNNNIENATMFLMAKSDRDARRMVIIPWIGFLIGPLIFFIPPLAATILHPNLAAEYPNLTNPHEAAFVAVCIDVMPVGLLGLLLCAMLGATLTSMDAGLNKMAGVFIRSFYLPVLRPNASEKHLLLASKCCTFCFGMTIVLIAVIVDKIRTGGLFDLINLLAASLTIPMALPLIYGLFFKRTPGWAAWSTALVATGTAFLTQMFFSDSKLRGWLDLKSAFAVDTWLGLNHSESNDAALAATTLAAVLVGTVWYFSTSLFYNNSSSEYRSNVEQFFLNLRTPLVGQTLQGQQQENTLYQLLGVLCLSYGAFIVLLMLIPNPPGGRLCFAFCGGVLFLAGFILYTRSRSMRRNHAIVIIRAPDAAAPQNAEAYS
jgi:Na+/proline symporter